ncbi:MAG: hypothetical protein K2G77_08245 [Muribaculaceae bacterium]|nr:hypothetical protein [Muribaculaceae bacterium]
MKKTNILAIVLLILVAAFSASAQQKPGKQALIEKYTNQLKTTTSARDSLRILYYIFDLSDRRGQMKCAWDIYYTAERAANVNAQLDMLRNLANFYAKNDSVIEQLLRFTDEISNEEARSATKTYILNQQLNRKSRNPNDTELQTILLDSITKSHNLEGKDIYDKLSLLYQIIQYLGVDADGVLFKECLDAYGDLIEDLPASDYPLKNQFYTTAAMIHSRMNGNPAKAIEYDKRLLEIIDQLQQMYVKKNRKFRNYDTNKFISYRRMMGNYKALSPEEIEIIHDSLQALHDRNPDVRKTMDKEGQAFAFYYMATKDYDNAIPALEGLLKNSDMSAYQKQKYNAMLIDAAKAINDQQTYIAAMEQYIYFSKEIDSLRKITMKREIMLRDSIINAPLLYKDSFQSQPVRHLTNREHIKIEQTLTIVASALAILLIIYVVLYIKLRQKQSER